MRSLPVKMCGDNFLKKQVKMNFFNLLLFLKFILISSRQQWYLTGKNFNDNRNNTKYTSEVINIWKITKISSSSSSSSSVSSNDNLNQSNSSNSSSSDEINQDNNSNSSNSNSNDNNGNYTHSSFGGAIAIYVGNNKTIENTIENLLYEILNIHKNNNFQFEVTNVWIYDIFVTVGQDLPLQYEIGLYDHSSAQFLKYSIHQVKLGREWRIESQVSNTITNDKNEQLEIKEYHRFVVTSDLYQTYTVTQHTWQPITNTISSSNLNNDSQSPSSELNAPISFKLRLMTYNIWHNNPPAWLLHDNARRWSWYQKRMRHLAQIIHDQNPDVITLQEVRLDNTFLPKKTIEQLAQYGIEYHFKDDPEHLRDALFSHPTGSQLHHILRYLHQVYLKQSKSMNNQTKECIVESPDMECILVSSKKDQLITNFFNQYQFVYQPAMSMYEREHMGKRVEEGLAILIKSNLFQQLKNNASEKNKDNDLLHSLHVSNIQTLFLPRNFEDSSDDHHRAVLHVELKLEIRNSEQNIPPASIDIMTTHMSLSSEARDESVRSIWNYTQYECNGDVQILTGDFNAEPHESSYGCLTGRCDEKDSLEDYCPCKSNQNPFQDAWLHSQKELRGYKLDEETNELYFTEMGKDKFSQVERDGYTFPPCNPEKRIDFVMIRNSTNVPINQKARRWTTQILSSWLVGKEVTPETAHLHQVDRTDIGMLDKDSPMWASDHYSVVTDVLLSYN